MNTEQAYISGLRKLNKAQRKRLARWTLYSIEVRDRKSKYQYGKYNGLVRGYLLQLYDLRLINFEEYYALHERYYHFVRGWGYR